MASEAEILRLLREIQIASGGRDQVLGRVDDHVAKMNEHVAVVRVDVAGIKVAQEGIEARVTRLEAREETHETRCAVVGPMQERVKRLELVHETSAKDRQASLTKAAEARSLWVRWGWEKVVAVLIAAGTLAWGWFSNKKH